MEWGALIGLHPFLTMGNGARHRGRHWAAQELTVELPLKGVHAVYPLVSS